MSYHSTTNNRNYFPEYYFQAVSQSLHKENLQYWIKYMYGSVSYPQQWSVVVTASG